MSLQGYIWNVGQSRKLKLSTVKEFLVRGYGREWEVVASLSGADMSIVHKADNKESCVEFVDQITKEKE
jgi:hypothetical protein